MHQLSFMKQKSKGNKPLKRRVAALFPLAALALIVAMAVREDAHADGLTNHESATQSSLELLVAISETQPKTEAMTVDAAMIDAEPTFDVADASLSQTIINEETPIELSEEQVDKLETFAENETQASAITVADNGATSAAAASTAATEGGVSAMSIIGPVLGVGALGAIAAGGGGGGGGGESSSGPGPAITLENLEGEGIEGESQLVSLSGHAHRTGDTDLTYTLLSEPEHGELILRAPIPEDGSTPGPDIVLTIDDTFTQDDLDAGRVEYIHDDTETKHDEFSFSVSDRNGNELDEQTYSISVTLVDDTPPTLEQNALQLAEGESLHITSSHINAIDIEQGEQREPIELTHTVTQLPQHGTLYLNDVELTLGSEFTQADIDGGALRYEHNHNDETQDTLGVTVRDVDGNATSYVFNIHITPVDDTHPEIINKVELSLGEDATVTITQDDLLARDFENGAYRDSAEMTYELDSAPTSGTLYIDSDGSGSLDGNESALGENHTFTQADIDNGLLRYRHDGDDETRDTFDFTVRDPAGHEITNQEMAFNIIQTEASDDAYDDVTENLFEVTTEMGLLANDDFGTASAVKNPGTMTLDTGATITINANGSFTYTGLPTTLGDALPVLNRYEEVDGFQPTDIAHSSPVVRVVDYNGDDLLDRVLTSKLHTNGLEIRFYKNEGSSFSNDYSVQGGHQFATSSYKSSDFYDWNGDGKADLLVAETGSSSTVLRFYTNESSGGQGRFSSAPVAEFTIPERGNSAFASSSDSLLILDEDEFLLGRTTGHLEHYRFDVDAGTLTQLTGDDTPFSRPFAESAGISVALIDGDGDGDLDMVASRSGITFNDPGSNKLHYFEKTEQGFEARTGVLNPFDGFDVADTLRTVPRMLEVADLDGDGRMDLVVGERNHTNPDAISYYRNLGKSFGETDNYSTASAAILSHAAQTGLLANDLQGQNNGVEFNIVAVSSDGTESQASRTVTDEFTYTLEDSHGNESQASVTLTLGDSNGDGSVRGYISTSTTEGGTVKVSTWDGSFTYQSADDFTGVDSFYYQISDARGSLSDYVRVEVLVLESDDPLSADDASYVFSGTVSGSTTLQGDLSDYVTSEAPTMISHINGQDDLTQTLQSGGILNVNANGEFEYDPVTVSLAPFTGGMFYQRDGISGLDVRDDHLAPSFADFNGDGYLDVVIGLDNSVRYYEGNASGGFTQQSLGFESAFASLNALGIYQYNPEAIDIDGDGDLDIAVGYTMGTGAARTAGVALIEDTGSSYALHTSYLPFNIINSQLFGQQSAVVEFIDQNSLVLGVDDEVRYFQKSAGVFVERTGSADPFGDIDYINTSGAEDVYGVTVGDVNGDGNLDLFASVDADNDAPIRYHEAPNYAEQAMNFSGLEAAHYDISVEAVDLDNDGDVDLVIGWGRAEKLILLENTRNREFGVEDEYDLAGDAPQSVDAGQGLLANDYSPAFTSKLAIIGVSKNNQQSDVIDDVYERFSYTANDEFGNSDDAEVDILLGEAQANGEVNPISGYITSETREGGVVTVSTKDGSFEYRARDGYTGEDEFYYQITDDGDQMSQLIKVDLFIE